MNRKVARNQTIEQANRFVRGPRSGFGDQGEIIEALTVLIALRVSFREPESLTHFKKASALEKRSTLRFHQRLQAADPSLPIIQIFERHSLEPLEREMLLLMIASDLGIVPPVSDMEDFQKMLRRGVAEQLKVAVALSENGRLAKADLITVNGCDDPMNGPVTLDPSILGSFLGQEADEFDGWELQSQEQVFERLFQLFTKLRERSASLEGSMHHFMHPRFGLQAANRKIERLTGALWSTLERHPEWPLSSLRWKLSRQETQMVVVLIGKDLGLCDADDELFLGDGIARAASTEFPKVRENLAALKRDRVLRKDGFIRICGGYGDSQAFDDDGTLRTCEFELTDDFRDSAGLPKASRRLRTRHRVRTPAVKLEQLVLPENVVGKLRMILAQVRHAHILLDTWGFAEILSYGRGVAALFAGPPGLGKTASAEALAHELGKPILTANYAEIESCWVGETEKNIARVFREAAEAGAVLFWDEADAMLYGRDAANRTWENRQVNILLQELERFEGLCIMATNRKVVLDRALERRIAIKVEFETPQADLRRRIWEKHLPPRMPLSSDLDLDWLARADLTGGEIKNAVLNAARTVLARDPHGPVTMADFERAIAMELEGRWNREGLRPIGFGCGKDRNRSAGTDGPVTEAARNGARKTKARL